MNGVTNDESSSEMRRIFLFLCLVIGFILYLCSVIVETLLLLRGMFPLVGFKSTAVYYERNERLAGESHYPLRKMIALALDGITSLSVKPLRLISSIGIAMAILSFIGVVWAICTQLMGNSISGWASTVSIICFIGSVQLICLGVVGEYIGKIYMEVKNRPRYIISNRTESSD